MLVLSRKRDEQIVLGDGEVIVTVIDIRGDKVRLGIEAPPEVSVHRWEVYEAILASRQKEAQPQTLPKTGTTNPSNSPSD